MKSLNDYILESQKTWQKEIIDIAKQYIIDPNSGEFVKSDIENGPEKPVGAMAIVTAMLLERFKAGKLPLAVVELPSA